jgi:hypothetical protein
LHVIFNAADAVELAPDGSLLQLADHLFQRILGLLGCCILVINLPGVTTISLWPGSESRKLSEPKGKDFERGS